MTVPFPQYIQAKDIYCILYLGDDPQILGELELLRPILSMQYKLDIRIIQKDTQEKFAGLSIIKDMASFICFLEENDLPVPKIIKR